jgi:hypothetical protein
VSLDALLTAVPGDGLARELVEEVEALIAQALVDGGVWETARTSDSLARCRVMARDAERVRLLGRIWTIDQTEHTFWLDLERGGAWRLWYELDRALSERRRRDAHDLVTAPEQIAWEHVFEGVTRRPTPPATP